MGHTLIMFPMSTTITMRDALLLDRVRYDGGIVYGVGIVYCQLGTPTIYDQDQVLTGTVLLMRCLVVDP
jgi:hypothetical protein